MQWSQDLHRRFLELRGKNSLRVTAKILGLTVGQVAGHDYRVRNGFYAEDGKPARAKPERLMPYNRRHYAKITTLELDLETHAEVEAIAKRQARPRAYVLRDLVEWGLMEYNKHGENS